MNAYLRPRTLCRAHILTLPLYPEQSFIWYHTCLQKYPEPSETADILLPSDSYNECIFA
jgi:hypothetical protein